MKTTLLKSALLLIFGYTSAQMDDKFYQPSIVMKPFEFSQKPEALKIEVAQDTITAYIAKPQNKNPSKSIFYFHGAGGNVTTYQFMTKPLVEAGYQLIMVDVRGYGKSTGTPTHLNIKEDAQKLFDQIIVRPDIKNTNIYIYGASLGTQIAANLARNNIEKISGLILDSPMSSFTEVAKVFAPQYANYIDQYVISPYSAKEDLKSMEGVPKLIIHSKDDKTIPYQQALSVFETAAEPKLFFESKGDHLEGLINNKTELLKAIENL